MRSSTAYLSIFLVPISALQIPSIFSPFNEPYLEGNSSIIPTEHDLLKRDGNCPTHYNSCSTFAAADAGACCTSGSVCTTDHAKNVACCPIGATCTGTLALSTATGAVLGNGATTTDTDTMATATATATGTGSVNYVSNAFFPFPIIPTSYSNSAACNSAFLDCQSNYAACTAELEGGNAFAVTIIAPQGGVTVSPTAQSLGVASATSICSSLSSAGCYNIKSSDCTLFANSFVAATGTSEDAAQARITMAPMVTAGMVIGMGLGVMGQMV